MTDTVTIAGRFNGPPGSGNGGYACGLVAAAIGPAAQVSLFLPPPLDVPLARQRAEDGTVRLLVGDATVAEGRPGHPGAVSPAPPSLDVATRATQDFIWRDPDEHPFPTCYVCGPLREADGLRVFPGPVGDDGMLACAWHPGAELVQDGVVVDPIFVWAALDCPSGFACIPPGSRTVLARMTAMIEATVHPGEAYIVTAWPIGSEGRKHRAGSAIHDADGRRIAVAEALWITLRDEAPSATRLDAEAQHG